MIIDSSALFAVLRGEPAGADLMRVLGAARTPKISAGTLLQAGIVVNRLGDPVLGRRLDDLLDAIGVVVEPVTLEQVRVARSAHRDFGKGSGHPARLPFGDCFSYALARMSGESSLFFGDDFGHTDLIRA